MTNVATQRIGDRELLEQTPTGPKQALTTGYYSYSTRVLKYSEMPELSNCTDAEAEDDQEAGECVEGAQVRDADGRRARDDQRDVVEPEAVHLLDVGHASCVHTARELQLQRISIERFKETPALLVKHTLIGDRYDHAVTC